MSPKYKGLIGQINKALSSQTFLLPCPAFLPCFAKRHKLFIAHLELSLIEGTNRHLVTRVAHIYKHHNSRLLFWSWQVLLVDAICQGDCRKQV